MIEKTFYYLYNPSDDKERKMLKCIEVLKNFHNSFWKRCGFGPGRGIYYALPKSNSEFGDRFIYLDFVSRDTAYGYDKDRIVNTDYDSVEKNMLRFVRLVREYEEREHRKGLIDNRDRSSMHPDIWKKYTMNDPFFNFSKPKQPSLTKVISSCPATIAFWDDGTKTVVKCQEGDTYDAEKGILYAILRKCMSNNKDYHNFLKETDRFKTFVEDMKATVMDESRATNFLNELEKLYIKYDISISHEDSQGGFILEPYNEMDVEWMRAAFLKDL